MDSDENQPAHVGTQSTLRAGISWSGVTLFLLSAGALSLCAWIVWPFLPALTGATVLAVVTRRPYRWLAARLGNPSLTAAVALILVVVSIITPVMFVAQGIGQHLLNAVHALQSGAPEHALRQFLDQHQRIASMFGYLADNIDPAQALQRSAGAATGKIGVLLGRSISALVQIVVMLFVLFFLFRDADQAMRLTRRLLPLNEEESDYLLQRIDTTITALVLGRFFVATVQGLIAGFTFALLGIDAAILLGAATMIFAVVPAVGAYVVWMPVVIYFALAHFWIRAIILMAVGALLISTIDNVLYPVLVGSRLRLHTVPIFLSMIGGIWLFGVTGLVLGPIIFNLTASLLSIWRSRTCGEPLAIE
jgi:predicted PurR-regulated permease PerM